MLAVLLAGRYCAGQGCTQTVPFNVIDRETGLAIAGLPAEALQAKIGKSIVPVAGVEQIHTRRLLVLLDQSGSISKAGDDVFSHERTAARITLQVLDEMMGELPPGLSVEYGVFNDQWVFGDGFISDAATLRHSRSEVDARFAKTGKGKTAIYDALHEGLMRFQATQPQDAILLFTDGEDNSSSRSAKQLETELHSAGVRLFTIVLAGEAFLPDQSEQWNRLSSLAWRSGGMVLVLHANRTDWGFAKPSQEAGQALRRFWNEQVMNGYLLRLQVPENLSKEQKWKLAISSDAGLKNAAVVYPDRLRPCPVSPPASR